MWNYTNASGDDIAYNYHFTHGHPECDDGLASGHHFSGGVWSSTTGGGTTSYINSDTTSGGIVFTRLGEIRVASAATVHIGSGTTVVMDVLSLF